MRRTPCASNLSNLSPLNDVEVNLAGDEMVEVPREQEYGVRNPRKLLDPKLPTKKDVDEHNLTHLPYRNWCQYCVEGKGKMAPRFKQPARTDGLIGPLRLLLHEHGGQSGCYDLCCEREGD